MASALITPRIGKLADTLNPRQRDVVLAPAYAALQVSAGAGTGKTELLARRFAKLVLDLAEESNAQDISNRIWISTFTEKAAQELEDRITGLIHNLLETPFTCSPWIGTFHSLCHRLLSELDKAAGSASQHLLTGIDLDILKETLFLKLIDGKPVPLKKAISHAKLPLTPDPASSQRLKELNSIIPCDTLFSEILFRIIPKIKAAGLSPRAFYRLARHQTVTYYEHLIQLPVTQEDGCTLLSTHEDYARAWRQHMNSYCHEHFSFFPAGRESHIAAQAAYTDDYSGLPLTTTLLDNLKPLYKSGWLVTYDGRKRKSPFSPAQKDIKALKPVVDLEKHIVQVVAIIYALYQYALFTEKARDYDDLILETLNRLCTDPDLLAHYQSYFRHFLVDEFQDANASQLQLLHRLHGTQSPRLTIAGDSKQSIYGFRFAQPEYLTILFENIATPTRLTLCTNYRSRPSILALANGIAAMMQIEPSVQLQPSVPNPLSQQGEPVTWLYLPEDLSLGQAKATEARWIVQTIARLLDQDGFSPHEIAILVRNHQKATALECELDNHGIPVIRQQYPELFGYPAVRLALSLLIWVDNPHSDTAGIALLQHLLTDRQLYELSRCRRLLNTQSLQTRFSYFDTLWALANGSIPCSKHLNAALEALAGLLDLWSAFDTLKQDTPPDALFHTVLDVFSGFSLHFDHPLAGQKSQKHLKVLKYLIDDWMQGPRPPKTLTQLLNRLRRYQAQSKVELRLETNGFYQDAVRILTCHGAKGLEFPVVFLAGVELYRKPGTEGLLTLDMQHPGKAGFGLFLNSVHGEKSVKKLIYDTVWHNPRSLAEELRLFYVGATRAQKRLYLSSWPRSLPYMNPDHFNGLPITVIRETVP